MSMEEIWKDIPDYEGIYQASNLGRVRTCEGKITHTDRHGDRHWQQRVLKPKNCISTCNKRRLDQRVELWKEGKHKTHLVARLVASAFYGKSNLSVNHIDGNTMNNQISNLEYVSLADNIRKGFEEGLYTKQVAIKIINKNTGQVNEFRSLAQAERELSLYNGYISNLLKHGKNENKDYVFER